MERPPFVDDQTDIGVAEEHGTTHMTGWLDNLTDASDVRWLGVDDSTAAQVAADPEATAAYERWVATRQRIVALQLREWAWADRPWWRKLLRKGAA